MAELEEGVNEFDWRACLDDEVEAGNIIMAARAHWFDEDKTTEDAVKNKLDDEQSSSD